MRRTIIALGIRAFARSNGRGVGLFAGDDLLPLLCRTIVCSAVTVSPMADGGLQTGCLSS